MDRVIIWCVKLHTSLPSKFIFNILPVHTSHKMFEFCHYHILNSHCLLLPTHPLAYLKVNIPAAAELQDEIVSKYSCIFKYSGGIYHIFAMVLTEICIQIETVKIVSCLWGKEKLQSKCVQVFRSFQQILCNVKVHA